jgi:methyl-accepting chemotaxis protein
MGPLSETAEAVQEVTSLAVEGDFSGRVLQRSSDEVGDIALNINRSWISCSARSAPSATVSAN